MKKMLLGVLLLFPACIAGAQAQKSYGNLYNPQADARAEIRQAVARAGREHKNVLLQIGGNWCIWCIRFHHLVETQDILRRLMSDNFIFLPVNYDQQHKNDSLWGDLGYPQRFGFPVFVVLDETGKEIHIQNSAYLEEGSGHSVSKVAEFLGQWSPAAIQGKTIKR